MDKIRAEKLGKCVICSKRVKTSDIYITTKEGYAHRTCIDGLPGIKA